MFALGIHYLNGWSMAAADGPRKERAEWPPHPDRVFMALSAAWFETGEDYDEGEALRWLETLSPPSIAASDINQRTKVLSYVPVNDIKRRSLKTKPTSGNLKELKKAGLSLLPEHRPRQPRSFPVAIPLDPRVYLVWSENDLDTHYEGLKQLVGKVTHIGHSASLVHVWVEEKTDIAVSWQPKEGVSKHRLRIPVPGRLDYLVEAYNKAEILQYAELKTRIGESEGKEKKQLEKALKHRFGSRIPATLRPKPSRWQGYDRPQENVSRQEVGSVFDPNMIVLVIKGKKVSLPATLRLTNALRGALMRSCPEQPPPEWFSGHKSSGTPTDKPHMALLPLPFVGVKYADGRIMGLALALPRELDAQNAGKCLEEFLYDLKTGQPRECRLFDAQQFECVVEMETRESSPKNLNPSTWTRKSRTWASVTPVVLNRHFHGKDKWNQASESVKQACSHIGLPNPSKVILHPVSLIEGTPHAREYPQMLRKSDGGRQSHSHAVIIFDEPVRGPVIIGAGRFRGYGLFRPID